MFAAYARQCAQNGYNVFPIPPRSKRTNLSKWNRWCETPPSLEEIDAWAARLPDHGIALACGASLLAIDIDAEDAPTAESLAKLIEIFFGPTPLIRFGRAPRRVLLYAASEPVPKRKIGSVDILGMGSYVMGFGIHPVTEEPYRWLDASPADLPLHRLPRVDPRRVEELGRALEAFHGRPYRQSLPASTGGGVPSRSRYVPVGETVTDGRDTYLFNLALRAVIADPHDEDAATSNAWEMFVATADLERHKRDGTRPWRIQDARAKVRWLIARPRTRWRASPQREKAFWTDARRRDFVLAVATAAADGRIPEGAWRLSQAMLAHIQGDGACYASNERLVAYTRRGIDTVKKARRQLVDAGLWLRGQPIGGRGTPNMYWPNPAALAVEREIIPRDETVDAQCSPNMQCETVVGELRDEEPFKDLVISQ